MADSAPRAERVDVEARHAAVVARTVPEPARAAGPSHKRFAAAGPGRAAPPARRPPLHRRLRARCSTAENVSARNVNVLRPPPAETLV